MDERPGEDGLVFRQRELAADWLVWHPAASDRYRGSPASLAVSSMMCKIVYCALPEPEYPRPSSRSSEIWWLWY